MDNTIQNAMDGFLAGLNAEASRGSYGTPLKHFAAFLSEGGVQDADALTVDHAIDFVPWLRERQDYAKESVKLYLTAVYRFYRHLLKGGADISAADLARLQEVYKDARDIRGEERPKDYTLDAVRAVVEAARAVPARDDPQRELARLRDIAVVETLRATGCRRAELAGLRLDDLRAPNEGRALVRGKGGKYRSVYWDETAWAALLAYLKARQVRDKGNVPVFVGHGNRSNGAPLSTRHVSRIVQVLAVRAGVPDVTPHYFRHVFATLALDKTGNLALVQDLLGHASPTTTRVYARTDETQRQAGHAQVWEEQAR